MTFYVVDFRQPPTMALFSCEARVDESTHDLQRKLASDDTRAETEHVAVIMLARLVSRIGVAAQRRAHATQFIRGDTCADAAAANQDTDLRSPALHTLSHRKRVIRVIVRLVWIMRAEILYLVPGSAQFFNHTLVERESSVICGDGDSHCGRHFLRTARA